MRNKYMLIGVVGIVVGVLLASVVVVLAGNLNSSAVPGATSSYMLEDIYNRLNAGTAGSESTFTEPSSGPTAGTGHTLDEVMAKAPAVDASGATVADVASGKTFWGLTSGVWGTRTGTATLGDTYEAGVPKTGQTKCYNAGGTEITCTSTGQDGEYQKGVSWPSTRFITSTTGIVTDTLTGLIWLKDGDCMGQRVWGGEANETFDVIGDLNAGTDFTCDSYTAGDYSDWRLPNVRELYSLIHLGQSNSATWLNTQGFSGVRSDYYWTSTTYAYNASFAWYVNLDYGFVSYNNRTYTYYVWPVRGGQ